MFSFLYFQGARIHSTVVVANTSRYERDATETENNIFLTTRGLRTSFSREGMAIILIVALED